MRVWTVSWQEGTGGEAFAQRLAAAAGVPLVDQQAIEMIASALKMRAEDVPGLERHLPGPLNRWAISLAATVNADAVSALQLVPTLRAVTEHVVRAAARSSSVLVGRGGFAILADHPGAYHLRLRAPLAWRVERYAAERLVSRAEAERLVRADDHEKHAYIRRLYQLEIDDPAGFTLVCDASRLDLDLLVEVALSLAAPLPVEAR